MLHGKQILKHSSVHNYGMSKSFCMVEEIDQYKNNLSDQRLYTLNALLTFNLYQTILVMNV